VQQVVRGGAPARASYFSVAEKRPSPGEGIAMKFFKKLLTGLGVIFCLILLVFGFLA
jgi:hypothetical protein